MKNEKTIRYIDLFGGVGGFRLGIERATDEINRQEEITEHSQSKSDMQNSEVRTREWKQNVCKCVFYSDIDKYAVQTYNKNFNENYEPTDIRTIEADKLPDFDMLCGGFPCQAFSIAGKRGGFEDTRGTLFFEIARIIKAKKPKIIFLENVKGLLSHGKSTFKTAWHSERSEGGKTFQVILETISELGYDVQWMVLNSKFFGVPQNRERVFIIGSLRGTSRPEILPFRESNTETKRMEQKKEIIIYPTLSTELSHSTGRDFFRNGASKIILAQKSAREIARVYNPKGIAPTLHIKTGGWQEPKIVQVPMRKEIDNGGRITERNDGISYTLGGGGRNSGRNLIIPTNTKLGYDIAEEKQDGIRLQYGESKTARGRVVKGASQSLQANSTPGVLDNMQIRRLTPIECERLQGFPDNWTEGVSDTQRYKQMGNAVTVNVIQAIAEKLLK